MRLTYSPDDVKRLASLNLFVQARTMDWVSLWIANWWSVGRDGSNDCGKDGNDGKLHLEILVFLEK